MEINKLNKQAMTWLNLIRIHKPADVFK